MDLPRHQDGAVIDGDLILAERVVIELGAIPEGDALVVHAIDLKGGDRVIVGRSAEGVAYAENEVITEGAICRAKRTTRDQPRPFADPEYLPHVCREAVLPEGGLCRRALHDHRRGSAARPGKREDADHQRHENRCWEEQPTPGHTGVGRIT